MSSKEYTKYAQRKKEDDELIKHEYQCIALRIHSNLISFFSERSRTAKGAGIGASDEDRNHYHFQIECKVHSERLS